MKLSFCQVQDKEVQEEEEEQVLVGGLDVVQRQGGAAQEAEEEAPRDGAHRRHVRDHDRGRGEVKTLSWHYWHGRQASLDCYGANFDLYISLSKP